MTLATEAADISRVNELLARARVALVIADRSSDLRNALLAVREARVHVELLSVIMRQIAAVEEPTQDTHKREDAA